MVTGMTPSKPTEGLSKIKSIRFTKPLEKIPSIPLLKNGFAHACVPPFLIFLTIANMLWSGMSGADVPLTLAIFLTGAGGGVISTYFRLKDVAPSRVTTNAIIQIYITPIVAGLLGWICYAFFLTGMLQGSLFPEFTGTDQPYANFGSIFDINPKTTIDAAKALLWAFVAGFSEKLIPNILDKLADQIEDEDASSKSSGGAKS
jgi:energy-converting hydrogenase Eha subunit C